MDSARARFLRNLLFMTGSIVAATLLRTVIDKVLHEGISYGTYYLAVIATSLYCGVGWGVACILLSGVFAALVLPPFGQFLIHDVTDFVGMVFFATVSGFIVWLSFRFRRSQERAEQAAEERQELLLRERGARAEAERLNRAKDDFLAAVSHELRTPLHAILGYGQLLAQEDLDVEAADSVEHILRGGKHLLALINEILDISRIESGTLALAIETVRVWDVVDEVRSFLSHAATPRTITLEVNVTRNLFVRADRQRLRQVLVNLGSNAIKYNRDGGHVDFIAEPSNGVVRIGVRDTGMGIDPAKQAHLFEPFQRLGADEMGVEGVGLGLVVSKALVEAMGGRIEVNSRPGVGTTFWTELTRVGPPIGAIASEDQFVDSAALAQLNPDARTVLYIEDNEANLQLVRRILALQGDRFRFLGASDGLDGLEQARTMLPDLILLDLHLPEIDGELVLQRLRDDPSTRDIPVVVLSADATPSRIERLVREGVFAYLTKPLDIAGFVSTIHDALQMSARE